MQIVTARSSQPRRITLAATATPSTTTTDYDIERADGGYSRVAVSLAWLVNTNTVELALSGELVKGVAYTISIPGDVDAPSYTLTYYGTADPAPVALPVGEDPAAEAYGVAIDWLSGGLTGSGDLIETRGRQCLIDDLVAIGCIEAGEIFHRPDDGGSLPLDVNGPAIPQQMQQMRSRLKRQWAKDSRIRTVDSIDFIQPDITGAVQIRAKLTESVTGEQVTANIPGGNG